MSPNRQLVIYDVGANNGCNISYYLLKAHKVVAIEANPVMASQIVSNYKHYIDAGRLVVENCVATAEEAPIEVDFYVHKTIDKLSQFPRPADHLIKNFQCLRLPSKSLVSILNNHGHPFYVKLDVEHYDACLLEALFKHGIFPDYLSAEYHSPEVFLTIAAKGGYSGYKLVDGRSINYVYKGIEVVDTNENKIHKISFDRHSAGPFGDDLKGDWHDVGAFIGVLGMAGIGWKDIHATRRPVDLTAQGPSWQLFLDQTISGAELIRYFLGRLSRTLAKRSLMRSEL